MQHWEQVHTETRNGFDYVLSFTQEDTEPDWDMTEEERAELLEKINNGTLLWFVAKMEVKRAGIVLATDYIGGCCYSSVSDFVEDGYYEDMISIATEEAENTLKELTKEAA
jgi:hypothetical protein